LTVKRALDLAAVWHHGQHRKYPGIEVPYLSHPAGVAIILSHHGFATPVVVAGVLHDVVEDTTATLEEIAAEFGPEVAALVRDVSEPDKSASWEDRKRQYLERFPHKPWGAQAITLADKIDNLRSILVCAQFHGDPWAQFKRGRAAQLQRFEALRAAAAALPIQAGHAIVDEYGATLDDVIAL
jgi:(p)ppGpp synthase/HD superfamily hydrolase